MSAQIFDRTANAWSRFSIIAIVALLGGLVLAGIGIYLSPWYTNQDVALAQPVPFSHKHHAGELKIECRYCHTTVEKAAFAGFPTTDTCMACHSQVWTNSPLLETVRQSYATGQPIVWYRVYNVPDFVYFNHSIHVNKGIGCSSCHGRIDQQQLTAKVQATWMGWCLDCHRNVEQNVRPREEVFNMAWEKPANQAEMGATLVKQYQIKKENLTNCWICHR